MKKIMTSLTILLTVLALTAASQNARGIGNPQATTAATTVATGGDPLGGATTFAKADKLTNITMLLDWTPNTNHLGIYIAQAKGFYTEANLKVDIQQAGGDLSLEQIVASGKAQFGISFQEYVTYNRASNVPIVSVAAIIQHNTSAFASLHDQHSLKTPADLVGLRYGSFGSPIEKPIIDALLKCAGVDDTIKPIQYIDISSSEPFPLMEKDRIDFAWVYYGWEGIAEKQKGFNVDFLMLEDYTNCVPDYYTPVLITSENMIKSHPDVVKAFVQATARGYAYAIQHPDEAAAILLKAAPDLDSALVKASSEWLASQFQADAPRWGEQRLEVWQNYVDFVLKNNAIDKAIDPKAAFTNDFLPGK